MVPTNRYGTRQIRRSLQIYDSFGVRHSDMLLEQAAVLRESDAGALPYNTRVFWLRADMDVLDARLDARCGLGTRVVGGTEPVHTLSHGGHADRAGSAMVRLFDTCTARVVCDCTLRVDNMLDQGLVAEIEALRKRLDAPGATQTPLGKEFTTGVLQV